MTSKYYVILTAIGAAKLANATALGAQLEITHMAIGDGGGVVPNPDATQIKLVNECYRAQLNSLSVDENNQNQIIAEMVLPETIGGWYIRETGLYDSVGDLIAVANAPESYKPQLQEGSGRTQVVRMVLIVSSTSNVSLKIDPAIVLATRQHVDQSISALEMRMKTALTDHEKSRCHPDATLSSKGFVKLSKSTDSDNDTTAATSSSIKAVSDQVSGKLSKAANLSDVEDVALVLENLGLTEQHFGYQNIQTYTDAGIYTFNVPDELCAGRKCWVEVYGGGGGGGAIRISSTLTGVIVAPAGGGGGGYAAKLIDLTDIDAVTVTVTVTVGVGGAGAITSGSTLEAGMAGGTSSFGAYCSASGGSSFFNSASSGGVGVGGDINASLGYGGNNNLVNIATAAQQVYIVPGGGGGPNGGSPMGLGTANGVGGVANKGDAYGGGGSGCIVNTVIAKAFAGEGAAGAVFIRW